MPTERTETERRTQRAYQREFFPAVAGYVVVLMLVVALVDFDHAGSWKYAVAALPVLPALCGVRAVARHLGRVDEMQRSVQLTGMAAGFGLAMIAAITIGFFAMAGMATGRWGPWAIYSAGMLGWSVPVCVRARSLG
jgi:uncharacterized membrane protein